MRQLQRIIFVASVLLMWPAAPVGAASLTRARTAAGVDYVSAGIGGIPGDTADIVLTGVNGTVTQALLYWDGLASNVETDVYDAANISFNGTPITGTSLGDSSTNCWGRGSSRAFVADVTPYVTGNGTFTLSGLASNPIYFADGASLVVLFDDGDRTNDHDLIFYEGNDSTDITNTSVFEDRGWHAFLDNIVYNGGNVLAQFHVADGQLVNGGADGDATLHGNQGDLTIPDTVGLWDGQTVPLMGTSRSRATRCGTSTRSTSRRSFPRAAPTASTSTAPPTRRTASRSCW
jgi:hypothetical protein